MIQKKKLLNKEANKLRKPSNKIDGFLDQFFLKNYWILIINIYI